MNYKYTGLFQLSPGNPLSIDGFVSHDIEVIKKSIVTLINTPKGSRIYDPELGTHLHRLIHELQIYKLKNIAKAEIQDVITKYEPRVEVLNVGAYVEGDVSQILIIFVQVLYKEFGIEDIIELRMTSEKEWIEKSSPDGETWDTADQFYEEYFKR